VKALLVGAAPGTGIVELLPRLAAAADLIVAVDGGAAACLQAHVRVDVVVGDFDSVASADLERLRDAGAAIVAYPAEKDASDLELALEEVRTRGASSVVVTGVSSGRPDHWLAALGVLVAAADLLPHVVETTGDMWVLAPEGRTSLELCGAGAVISLLAFGGPTVVSASGVAWQLENAALEPASSQGLSNRIGAGGRAIIRASRGALLVFAPLVRGCICAQEP
jgi:thiamine pyrophosphokinase